MTKRASTLLDDTLLCIALSGHTVEQIVFIGTESGYSLCWDEFASLIRHHSHISDIARDLVIEFSDGKTLWRECDFEFGGSNWAFQRPFNRPFDTVQPITILSEDCWCPEELEAIQEQAIIKRDAETEQCESAAADAAFETEMALANRQRPIIQDLAGLNALLRMQ